MLDAGMRRPISPIFNNSNPLSTYRRQNTVPGLQGEIARLNLYYLARHPTPPTPPQQPQTRKQQMAAQQGFRVAVQTELLRAGAQHPFVTEIGQTA